MFDSEDQTPSAVGALMGSLLPADELHGKTIEAQKRGEHSRSMGF